MGLWFNARLIGKCELTQRRVVAVWRRVAHCQQAWFAASARVHPPWAGGARGIVFVCLHRDMVTWSAPFGSVCQEGPVLCEDGPSFFVPVAGRAHATLPGTQASYR